jgi:peptidyl-tRNA hydrolase, PTH1 family
MALGPGPSRMEQRSRIRLVAGLGNPGDRYRETRHNVGFRVVEELARRRGLPWAADECNARLAEDGELLLVQPQTYMNRSGFSLRCLRERREIAAEGMLVVFDDVHLPLGKLRLRRGGSPGGHRGMESVADGLQTDEVPRLRLGVGGEAAPAGDALPDYVLARFATAELAAVAEMVERAADACEAWLELGLETAMNRFNR